jgi:CBS domain-containing protein
VAGRPVPRKGTSLAPVGGSTTIQEIAMQARDIMSKNPRTVTPDLTVREAARLMKDADVGVLPVVEAQGSDSRLVGMVTDRDIVCKGLANGKFDPGRATASDVMTEGIHCCREDDDLAKAIHHMETLKVRRLPVINKNKRMVGMISLGDLSHFTSGELMSGYVKSVAVHH